MPFIHRAIYNRPINLGTRRPSTFGQDKGDEIVSQKTQTGLSVLDFLIGKWKGHGAGFGNTSVVEQEYELVLQEKFIRSMSHSVAHDDEGQLVEVHDDWGMFSFDSDREAIVLREFYSEGYVNIYVMREGDDPGNSFVFTSERTEGAGGLQAQLRLNLLSNDEFQMFLDLARPGENFRECLVMRMKRIDS
jgi:hypothetical protein